ncbi:hypothetical protein SEA_LUCKYSOCKE_72 [Streptomyces phage LuckySocke]|jgi:hypothetical protein|nr:hypothetical protein SEA_ALONE_74 [Streptomyces phage Alone3]WPH58996.1 hypothetical protein SEA_LUCKYSOCKE_72 [Streptomyces phage LuckySocke]
MEREDITNRATFHPVKPGQAELYEENRKRALEYALWINDVAPDSREKSLAIGALLDDVVFQTNAAIARHS